MWETVGFAACGEETEKFKRIVDFLTDGLVTTCDWKYRFKENSERMRTGSLLDVAAVLRVCWY